MDFKLFLLGLFGILGLAACAPTISDNFGDDNHIGEKLKKVSSLNTPIGEGRQHVALFDETVKKIQIFDLVNNIHEATLDINSQTSKSEHSLLYSSDGSYVIDLSKAGFSIIKKDNSRVDNPLRLLGVPTSAAFRDDLGYLIVHDDVGSIGLLKLSPTGEILKSTLLGSRINSTDSQSIGAGDLLDDGTLVTALSDGSLATIDVEKSIDLEAWSYSKKSTGLSNIEWISRIQGNSSRIVMRSSLNGEHTLILFDLNSQSVLSSLKESGALQTSSRFYNPHIVISSYTGDKFKILYLDGGSIKKIEQFKYYTNSLGTVVNSILDLSHNSINLIEVKTSWTPTDIIYINSYKENRTFQQFRFSDLLLKADFALPDKAMIEQCQNKVLALFPNKLGYATVTDSTGKKVSEFKFFNRKSMTHK